MPLRVAFKCISQFLSGKDSRSRNPCQTIIASVFPDSAAFKNSCIACLASIPARTSGETAPSIFFRNFSISERSKIVISEVRSRAIQFSRSRTRLFRSASKPRPVFSKLPSTGATFHFPSFLTTPSEITILTSGPFGEVAPIRTAERSPSSFSRRGRKE